jgi:hypothetical protein
LRTPNFGDPSRPILRVKGEELAQAKEEVGDGALCIFHALPPFVKQLPIFLEKATSLKFQPVSIHPFHPAHCAA